MSYITGVTDLRGSLLLLAGVMLAAQAGAFAVLPGGAAPDQRLPSGTPYRGCFEAAARQHEVPAVLLAAVARVESAFNPTAVSSKEAVGVMQIRWPVTARHLGITRRAELFDPCVSIDAGARYLRELFTQFGVTEQALAAYNMGPSRIESSRGALPRAGREYVDLVTRALARLGHDSTPVQAAATRAGTHADKPRISETSGREFIFRMPTLERAQATVRALERRGTLRARIREEGSAYVVIVEG